MDSLTKGAVKSIGIIGDSIGGLAAAALLHKQGHSVKVLRGLQYTHPLYYGYSRAILPTSMVTECKKLGLFDETIPEVPCGERSFFTDDHASFLKQRIIWKQSLGLTALNCRHIYSNLYKRLPKKTFMITLPSILSIENKSKHVEVKPFESENLSFDLLIAADGINSVARKTLYPNIVPTFRNYISWHGTIQSDNIANSNFFPETSPIYLAENCHFLLYKIPAPDYETSKKMLLSWSLYIHVEGLTKSIGLPTGDLSKDNHAYLHQLALARLPTNIAYLIRNTQTSSIQSVFDYIVPSFVVGNTCLLGQAGADVGPHAASPELRELTGALSLAEALDPKANTDIKISLAEWNESQLKLAKGQKALSEKLGRGFVTTPPDWPSMDSTSMGLWWQAQIDEKPWQPPAPKKIPWIKLISEEDDTWPMPLTPSSKQFTPSLNSKAKAGDLINDLCTDLQNGLVLEEPKQTPPRVGC